VTEPAIERYFAVLGLPSTASEEEVKEARNFVTKAFHPDKYEAGSKDQRKAHQRQIEINEAYERLSTWFQSKKRVQGAAAVSAGGKRAGARRQAGDIGKAGSTDKAGSMGKAGSTDKAGSTGKAGSTDKARSNSHDWATGQASGEKAGFTGRGKIVAVSRIVLPIILSIAWMFLINASYSSRAQTGSASVSMQSPGAGAFVSPPPDWLFLLLILCTLALCWVTFAPESKLLIDRWTKEDGGHESIGNRGVGGN
jgi:DnaJ domain